MPIVDLTHTIDTDMPIYPGTQSPELIPAWTLEKDGFAEAIIRLGSHTGTHIDAPAHLIAGGTFLDSYAMETFRGIGHCADLRHLPNLEIGRTDLECLSETLGSTDFLLLNTGWSERWGTAAYFEQHPVLSLEAAKWLTGFNLKAVGLDNSSADRFDSTSFPIHQCLLGMEILIIENLTRLDRLPAGDLQLTCLPLKLAHADGAPVRVIAEFKTARVQSRRNQS
jgi:arylformamidase